MSEINITLFHPPTSKTDAISIQPSTTLSDVSNFASALLGLDGDSRGVVLTKGQSRQPIYNPSNAATAAAEGGKTLSSCGIGDGEFISAYRVGEFERALAASSSSGSSPARQRQRTAAPPAAAAGGGGLDFSSLLGASAAAPTRPATSNAASGGMDFSALLSSGAAAASSSTNASSTSSTTAPASQQPVEWDGMTLEDAMERNRNPIHLMTILTNTTRHPNLFKECNFRYPTVAKKLQQCNNDIPKMVEVWRQTMMKSVTANFLRSHLEQTKEMEMTRRLHVNPMDAEANKYFGEKIRLQNVQRQYEQMMEEYPESMGRVLMLYMNCLVNKKPLQVFVDSGAQMTIMSSGCADRLGILHLVDNRFEGVAVGVGTGKILGKIHIVELNIGGYDFPCSITVMDSEAGLGDKNMDCLFGLDMLKRHRCCIDLGKNVLRFAIGHTGQTMEAPFLHEHELPVDKGGTLGFDAEKVNAEIDAQLEKMETKEEGEGKKDEGKKEESGGDGDKKMDENEDGK